MYRNHVQTCAQQRDTDKYAAGHAPQNPLDGRRELEVPGDEMDGTEDGAAEADAYEDWIEKEGILLPRESY